MLLLMVAVFVNMDSKNTTTTTTTISNSYNTDSYNNYASVPNTQTSSQITYIKAYEPTKTHITYVPTTYKQINYPTTKYIALRDNGRNCKTIRNDHTWIYDHDINGYKQKSMHTIEKGLFGTKVDKYQVYITNKEKYGKQFTVKFYFTDHRGEKITEVATKYIQSGDERIFNHQTIYGDKYNKWDYKIFSDTTNSNYKQIDYITKKVCY